MATEGIGVSGLAARYASALFDLADEQRDLDGTARDLTSIREMLNASEDLRRLIRSPLIPRADQARAMEAILSQAGTSDLVRRFVGLVAEKRRLFALPQMIEGFLTELARRRGEETAHVISARPLTQAQLEALTDVLMRSEGSKVRLQASVDPSLIGGLIVRLGSRMVDNSLRTKLARLKLAMKGV